MAACRELSARERVAAHQSTGREDSGRHRPEKAQSDNSRACSSASSAPSGLGAGVRFCAQPPCGLTDTRIGRRQESSAELFRALP